MRNFYSVSIHFSFLYSPLSTQFGFSQQIGVHFRSEKRRVPTTWISWILSIILEILFGLNGSCVLFFIFQLVQTWTKKIYSDRKIIQFGLIIIINLKPTTFLCLELELLGIHLNPSLIVYLFRIFNYYSTSCELR